ncbi:MAG: hypothetical protein K2M77_08275 [Muribaculaceae bacterium]|nr:hypothetical protein [Muribaculaceae bacterium]
MSDDRFIRLFGAGCSVSLVAAVATYNQCWKIETGFRAMKSSGFNIEDNHLRDIARLTSIV